MFSSKNTQMNERKNRSKVTRYAIKKLSMGTASVAVALGFLFVQGQSVVLADTIETTQSTTETKAEETSEKVEATTEETTTTSEEQAPRTRTRREAGDAPAATSPVGVDVEDATATPKVTKPGFTKELSQEELLSQASWIDFGDVANWSGTTTTSTGQMALQEGSTYTKEISPGYVVTVRVKSLKPFNSTEIYKKRLEAQGATAAEKNTYDPNAKNGYMNSAESADGKREFKAGKEALIVGEPQDAWSEIYNSGIDTGEKRTTITTQYEGGNVGVQFEITGTYKGKTVKPTVLMTEGDSSNLGELSLYTTNGTGWQHFAEWYKYDSPYTLNYFPQDTKDLFDPNKKVIGFRPLPINGVNYHSGELAAIREATQVGPDKKPVAWKYYGSPDQKTGGLGTGVFGPNLSAGMVAVPIVMTQGATEVSLYMASASKQSAMIGFLPFDESDAPGSYGKATHSINQVHNVTGEDVKQPYLGDTRPDVDENVDRTNWKGDDVEGSADEGIDQILPADLKGKTNGILVLDRTNTGDLTMSVEVHTGGADEATLYGWVDFNGNGTFDEDERSEKLTITTDGTATLVFKDAFKKVNVALSELGARVRIAKDATQIEKPTGMALSGEVEDFEVHLTFLPKGSKTETDGLQGIPQTGTVVFTPSGKQRYSLTDDAVIDEAIEPVIVDKTGAKVALDAEGYYVVDGEGKYKVTGAGKDVTVEFIPEDGFVGTGKGITIRRTDDNGNDTEWTPVSANEKIVSDQTNTMDGRYIPTVVPMSKEITSTKVQGLVHVETPQFEGKDGAVTPSSEKPMVLVDPKTGKALGASAPAMKDGKEVGTYTVDETTGKVTFTPNKDFTRTADAIVLQVIEKATGKAIAGLKYTPTVTAVTPTGEDVTSTGKQGKVQTGTPKFTEGDAEVPLKVDADQPAKFVVNGTAVEDTTIDAMKDGVKVGFYAINPLTGEVIFTPNKDFVGTPDAATVQVKDENGTTATAKYTPNVTAATPTGEDVTSTGKQGKVQTGTPKFTEGDAEVPLKVDADQPAKFVVNGTAVEDTTIDAVKDGAKVGTYTLDPLTGEVTFTPNKDFVGTPDAATVQVKDENGISATAKYIPTVTSVTPTGEDAASTGKQGKVQIGTPKFTEGDVEVPLKVDADQPAKFVVNGTAVEKTTIDATKDGAKVGTYAINPLTGEVTFTPNKDFSGTLDAVTVQVRDENGTVATATYTPTVTAVTPTGEDATSTGKQGKVQTGTPKFTEGDAEVPLKVDADQAAKFIVNGTAVEETTIDATKDGAKVGTYEINPLTGEVTFTPNKDFVGTPDAATVQVKDENGTATTAKYTPTVTAVTPTGEDVTTTGKQGKVQTGTPKFTEGDAEVPLKVDADQPAKFVVNGTAVDDTMIDAMKDGAKVGTYTINPLTGEVTFTPNKDFVATPDAATVQVKDENGISATAKYIPTVTSVTPTGEDAASTGKQGKVQIGTPKFTEGDVEVPLKVDADQPAKFVVNGTAVEKTTIDATKDGAKVGTYAINPLTGEVTFTPNKDFSGTLDAVTVQVRDENGTVATATYTPTVTAVTPTGEDATSTGKQGKVQTGTPKFTEGDAEVPLKVDADQAAKFIVNGTAVEETTIDATKEGAKVGTYTIDPLTGEVTFTPNKDFVGTPDAVTVQVKDENGTATTAKYTPTVTAVTPTGEDVTTTGKQGKVQTGTPKFTEEDAEVPLKVDADQPAKFVVNGTAVDDTMIDAMKDGAKVGTYTINPLTGEVTFTPNKDFVATPDAATVQVKDENGISATAKYIPTVTSVTPTGEDAASTGKQGKVQIGTPKFTEGDVEVPLKVDADQPAKFVVNGTAVDDTTIDAVKDGAKVGTYTLDPLTGEVTFTPNKDFVGTPDAVTVQVKDENGTSATAKYTPTVTAVTPTGEDVSTTGKQGKVQTGTPKFTEGDAEVPLKVDAAQPAKFVVNGTAVEETTIDAMKDGAKVGTYTLDPLTGEVTFTPNKDFVGTPDAVTVQVKDENGTSATAKYTPTVTAVTPTGEDVTSTDVQGKAQTAKPTFTEGDAEVPLDDSVPVTFEDGTTEKVIAGVGTFTVAADGTITFVPEASFTGETPAVTIQRVDMNGTVAKASYTATVTPAPVDPVKPEEPTKPENPAQPEEPAKPVEPAEPAKPVEPEKPVVTDPQQTVVAPAVEKTTQTELPNTGTTDEFAIFNAAALSILASLGLVATSRKKEEQEA